MKYVRKACFSLLLIVSLLCSSIPVYAEGQIDCITQEDEVLGAFGAVATTIKSTSDKHFKTMLSEMNKQGLNSAQKSKVEHLLYTSNYKPIPVKNKAFSPKNSAGTGTSHTVKDGTYSINVGKTAGCYAYCKYASLVVYGKTGDRLYEGEKAGKMTGSKLKKFIKENLQAGEHLRLDGEHSVTFMACTDSGLYYTHYLGDSNPYIYLAYATYDNFAAACNKQGKQLWVYNANTKKNAETPVVKKLALSVKVVEENADSVVIDITRSWAKTIILETKSVTTGKSTEIALSSANLNEGNATVKKKYTIKPFSNDYGQYKVKITVEGTDKSRISKEVKMNFYPTNAIGLNVTNKEITVGSNIQLTAAYSGLKVITPHNSFKWSSSDETIAKVSNGLVTGLKPGKAVITAKSYHGKTASCQVVVKQAAASVPTVTPKPTVKPAGGNTFADVPAKAGNWKYEAVKYVSEKKIMTGVGGNQFKPDAPLTRAMFATMLYRMAGQPSVTYTAKYTDVPANKWYSNAVIWASQKGIVDGYGNGRFGVNDSITREQMAKMLMEYGKVQGYNISQSTNFSTFADAGKVSKWANSYMKWAVGSGMISGSQKDGKSYLNPRGNATRAESATMLKRFVEKYN